MDFDSANFALTSDVAVSLQHANGNGSDADAIAIAQSEESAAFKRALASSLMPGSDNDESAAHRVLAFKNKAPAPSESHVNNMKVLYSQNRVAAGPKVKSTRHIPSVPERILDAPEMVDDYYLNVLDWSSSNILAVALGPSVYLWNASTGNIDELMHTSAADDYITSVSWIKEGGAGHLAIGTAGADVQLWDCEKMRQVRSMKGHSARVAALDWNNHILSSGSRDTNIFNHDVRIREHHISTFAAHSQEVCALKWSPDGSMLASGSNDNLLNIWDAASATTARAAAPKFSLSGHQAAVKAMAWCPWQKGVLATGGGTADRCIKIWNASTGSMLNSVDTGSQVCSLLWNQHERELLSSHGFSQNQLILWKYPTMTKVKELTGHTARVLHMAAGPDGSTVCSAGADETLRFWRVFGENRSKVAEESSAPSAPAIMQGLAIR
jgi:cell division cycle protein 20 (cofactor of APC complex)